MGVSKDHFLPTTKNSLEKETAHMKAKVLDAQVRDPGPEGPRTSYSGLGFRVCSCSKTCTRITHY